MDPIFKQLRLTRTCEQWVLDTIDMRYDTFYDTGTTSKSGRSKDLQDTESEHYGNTVAFGSNLAPPETPGVTVLYKAIGLGRLWNTSCRLLDSEGRLGHMGCLYTFPLRSIFNRS
uniref:WGS project CBMI000000000 data, contig CS3069_c001925 n=1 Tax=Fusarium clavum TaxID=2594811 RepID=A0A090MIB8_9HYPO|nr:unnamed protein product [Fusarium clavum]CEG05820.1 unnamed protein product [Fusarium clavum]